MKEFKELLDLFNSINQHDKNIVISILLFVFWISLVIYCKGYRKYIITIGIFIVALFVWNIYGEYYLNYFQSPDIAKSIMTGSAGIIAALGVFLAVFRMRQTDEQISISNQQFQLAADNRLDSRFKDMVTLLGSPNRSVRIGGLYGLVEISKSESKRINADSGYISPYPKAVVEIICGFIRIQSNEDYDSINKDFNEEKFISELREKKPDVSDEDILRKTLDIFEIKGDVQTTLTLLFNNHDEIRELLIKECEIDSHNGSLWINKNGSVCKENINAVSKYYETIIFKKVPRESFNLSQAKLIKANLNGAYMNGVILETNLDGAEMSETCIITRDLNGSSFKCAFFHYSYFESFVYNVNFSEAYLTGINFKNTHFSHVNLTNATIYKSPLRTEQLCQIYLDIFDERKYNISNFYNFANQRNLRLSKETYEEYKKYKLDASGNENSQP